MEMIMMSWKEGRLQQLVERGSSVAIVPPPACNRKGSGLVPLCKSCWFTDLFFFFHFPQPFFLASPLLPTFIEWWIIKIITKVIIKGFFLCNRQQVPTSPSLNNTEKEGRASVAKSHGQLKGRTDLGGFKYSLMVLEKEVFRPPRLTT